MRPTTNFRCFALLFARAPALPSPPPLVRRSVVMATDVARKRAPDPVTVLRGHTCDVQALAFLPDGRLLAGCVAGRWLTRMHCSLAYARTRACCYCHGGSDADGIVKLWDTGVRRATHTVRCVFARRAAAAVALPRCRAAAHAATHTRTRSALTGHVCARCCRPSVLSASVCAQCSLGVVRRAWRRRRARRRQRAPHAGPRRNAEALAGAHARRGLFRAAARRLTLTQPVHAHARVLRTGAA